MSSLKAGNNHHCCNLPSTKQSQFPVGRIRPTERTDTKSHLLLDEDLHQVDVTTSGCCMQRGPELIVLGIDIGPMVEEELDYVLIVVYAALGREKCRQIRVFQTLENEGSFLLSYKIVKCTWTWRLLYPALLGKEHLQQS